MCGMKKATKRPSREKAPAVEVVESVETELYAKVCRYIARARAKVYAVANTEMVVAYWNVGREIVAKQGGAERAKYGDGLIKSLALRLTAEFGPGYTVANLRNMRQFFLTFPKRYTLCSELTWSHFRVLMRIENEAARKYYLEECTKSKWSVRDLKRQIETHFYERLVANHVDLKDGASLVKRTDVTPQDIVRSPAILEFAGLAPGDYRESDLERGLIQHLGKFMMELGRGFCLEREQRPIPVGGKTYYCDLVFYNYVARCFVLIDLKVGEITPEDLGQMMLYKHFYEREMMRPGDNPPVGIVLGSERNEAVIRCTLNEHERNLFAVKYHLDLPSDDELALELQRERALLEERRL
jgi:predicted nuclease of restriction endonuclease-like (RecB) superfamily